MSLNNVLHTKYRASICNILLRIWPISQPSQQVRLNVYWTLNTTNKKNYKTRSDVCVWKLCKKKKKIVLHLNAHHLPLTNWINGRIMRRFGVSNVMPLLHSYIFPTYRKFRLKQFCCAILLSCQHHHDGISIFASAHTRPTIEL